MRKRYAFGASALALTIFLSVALINAPSSEAAPRRAHARAPSCSFLGVTPLKKFLRKNEWTCFKSTRAATTAGYTALTFPRKSAVSAHAFSCAVPAVKASQQYFNRKYSLCFASSAAVKRAKYKHYVAPTATPTPTPGSNSLPTPVPTATPTPSATVQFPVTGFILGSVENNGAPRGTCNADLAANHLTVNCSTDITDAGEAHLHVNQGNDPFCAVENPGSDFQISCDLTDDQAAGFRAGTGEVAVHNTSGQEEAAGFVRQ